MDTILALQAMPTTDGADGPGTDGVTCQLNSTSSYYNCTTTGTTQIQVWS